MAVPHCSSSATWASRRPRERATGGRPRCPTTSATSPGSPISPQRVHRHGALIAAQLNHHGRIVVARRRQRSAGARAVHPGGRRRPTHLDGMVTAAESRGDDGRRSRKPTPKFEYRVADRERPLVGDRALRRGRRPVRPRRLRRRRAPRRPRIPHRRVPVARRTRATTVGAAPLEGPGPAARRGAPRDPASASATTSRSGSGSTRSSRTRPTARRFDDQLQVIDLAVAAGIDAVHVTAYADTTSPPAPPTRTRRTSSARWRTTRPSCQVARDGAGDHVRPLRARRGRAGLADGKADFVVDGAQAARRPRSAEQAGRRSRRRHPPVHLPVPVHRQHLRERAAALRRERGNRS